MYILHACPLYVTRSIILFKLLHDVLSLYLYFYNILVAIYMIYTMLSTLSGTKPLIKARFRDFPGGAVVKNLPANAGDTGSIHGPGRSHMPQSKIGRASCRERV